MASLVVFCTAFSHYPNIISDSSRRKAPPLKRLEDHALGGGSSMLPSAKEYDRKLISKSSDSLFVTETHRLLHSRRQLG